MKFSICFTLMSVEIVVFKVKIRDTVPNQIEDYLQTSNSIVICTKVE